MQALGSFRKIKTLRNKNVRENYNPKDFEEKIYADWENSGDFKPT